MTIEDQVNDQILDVIWALIEGLPETYRDKFVEDFSDRYELYTVEEVLSNMEPRDCR